MYSSCSEKAPFVVHKITIDYAFDQVFRAKMQSLHENFAPQILTFMHELPFFPSYFVWNPLCFSFSFSFSLVFCVFLLPLLLPSLFTIISHFCQSFLIFSLVPSIFSHEIRKTWEIFLKISIVFQKISTVFLRISIVFWGYSLTSNV